MRFFGNVAAWVTASIVTYVLAAIASHQVVLAGVDRYRGVDLGTNLRSTADAVFAQPQIVSYLAAILIGFAVAFFVADIVKALIPVLAPIAYPTAGAFAIVAMLEIMEAVYGVVPILGAQETYGYWLQIAAGVVGGVVFELARPKSREEVAARERRRTRTRRA